MRQSKHISLSTIADCGQIGFLQPIRRRLKRGEEIAGCRRYAAQGIMGEHVRAKKTE